MAFIPNRQKVHSLTGRITPELVLAAFLAVKRNRGAAGIDKVSIQMFAANLDANLQSVMRDLKNGSFQPKPLRRQFIDKGNGKLRPLGIPAVRDRVAQEVLRRLLSPVFEPKFHDASYGFRPGRNCHAAIERVIEHHENGDWFVLDADIQGFFDNLPHPVIMAAVAAEVADGNILCLIEKFLRSGVMENGVFKPTTVGTPQGGVISPLLANIVLNHLDWHLHKHGLRFVRYADDFVVVTPTQPQAEEARTQVEQLLGELGLTLSPDKTHITRPSGKYLMEDFYYAGGLRSLLNTLRGLLRLDATTVTGRSLGENIEGAAVFNDDVIRPIDKPLVASDSLAVLRGNLAPDGAVIKPAAAEQRLHRHTGRAVVFADYNDMAARIDDPDLPVDKESVIVLKHAGPLGAPGMPEWGQLPIPKKLLQAGVRDMVRISDARMSGTSFGACVLHVAPESFIGGPLALVQDGDLIELDVPGRRLTLRVDDAQMMRRRRLWKAPAPRYTRGYGALFCKHVTQANQGCDFDFLEGTAPTPDPEIH